MRAQYCDMNVRSKKWLITGADFTNLAEFMKALS
jgi:hypothetical protein